MSTVKIMGADRDGKPETIFEVSVEDGKAVVIPVTTTQEGAEAFAEDLERGIWGRGKKGVLKPGDDGFLDEMHFEFKSAYFYATRPE